MPAGMNAEIVWLGGFRGLNDGVAPGNINPTSPQTNELLNVKVRFGEMVGRGGMDAYEGADPTVEGPVVGLMAYNRALQTTNQLLRLLPSKLELLESGIWVDKTGDSLNGTALTRPQYTQQNDILVYTMEGLSRPQGFGSNPGVGVAYTTGTTLGGTPPFCKNIVSYMQFLLLGNVSDDGTFTDVLDGWRTIIYSDDPFFNWTNCLGNNIDLYQTPGKLMAMKVLGRDCMCYKDDGVIRLTWVGTAVRFTQDLIPGSVGTAAPMSVTNLGAFGHAYLGTDGVIYHNNGSQCRPISSEQLEDTLPPLIELNRYRYARCLVRPSEDLYVLLYDRTGLSGQFLNSYATWNYRTGEFTKGRLGVNIIAADAFKPEEDSKEVALLGSTNQVYEYDSPNSTTDNGVKITRTWNTGWQKFGGEEGFLYGAALDMQQDPNATIKVSVAKNMQEKYESEQTFSLAGIYPTTSKGRVELHYRFPSPVPAGWFNFKVELLNNKAGSITKMFRFGSIGRPAHKYPVNQQTMPNLQPSRG